jgi:NADH-quinone oxidoreductase subunit N
MTFAALTNQESLLFLLPQIVLTLGALSLLFFSMFRVTNRTFLIGFTVIVLLLSMKATVHVEHVMQGGRKELFNGLTVWDSLSYYGHVFFQVIAILCIFFIHISKTFANPKRFIEALAFLLVLTIGLIFMMISKDILMMFLAVEMVSILSYLLVSSKDNDAYSSEAGLKYILYGAVASGLMIYGFSFLFGLAGSSDLHQIGNFLAQGYTPQHRVVVFFSFLAIFMGFGFKMATFPTQMWCPDVYQGAPIPISAFLSVGPKAAGFLMMIRFIHETLLAHTGWQDLVAAIELQQVLGFFAIMTMFIGNVGALRQKSLKRLMAYSSIAHAGFILLGIASFTPKGFEASIFYLVHYVFMNLGAFYIIHLRILDTGNDHIDSFRGFGNQNLRMAVFMTIFLFSLTGLPPFSGFISKFYIFSSLIQSQHYVWALLAAVNTAIALYYYVKIIKWMFLKEGNDPTIPRYAWASRIFTMFLVVPVIVFGVYWKPVQVFVRLSLGTIFP